MSHLHHRILIVEDEVTLAEGIRENLEAEGYVVDLASDGLTGLEKTRDHDYDLVILDVMLPEMDGITVCETLREEGVAVPVLFLTARSSVDDRILGLEVGGDDYLTKPFNLRELLLRVSAVLRRRNGEGEASRAGAVIRFGENEFNFRTFRGRSWDGEAQTLTEKEAMIFKTLVDREGEVVTREEILDRVWGHEVYPSSRTLDRYIRRLRNRFEADVEDPQHFHTQRGIGYRFTAGA